eukprot:3933582-Rhodomonas_salina.1
MPLSSHTWSCLIWRADCSLRSCAGYGIFSYDPATLVATHLSPSITGSAPRSWPSAGVAFGGGKIYLFGGYNYGMWRIARDRGVKHTVRARGRRLTSLRVPCASNLGCSQREGL